MAANKRLRQSQFATESAHFVLEQFAQRLDEFHLHARGETADIVMRFDRDRGTARERHAFDHVWIERALRKKIRAANFLRFLIEHIDKEFSNRLALHFWIADAFKRIEEQLLGVHMDERNVVMILEKRDDFLRFAQSQQPMIDEDASELIANRFMDENGCDG